MHFTPVVVQMHTVYPAAFCKRLHNGELKSPSANTQLQAIMPALSFPLKYNLKWLNIESVSVTTSAKLNNNFAFFFIFFF